MKSAIYPAICVLPFLIAFILTACTNASQLPQVVSTPTTMGATPSRSPAPSATSSDTPSPEPTVEPTAEPYMGYSDKFVSFEYPGTWDVVENQSEDGLSVVLVDSSVRPDAVFWYTHGAAIYAESELAEDFFEGILSQYLSDVNITAFTEDIIDGKNAKKLIYNYTKQDVIWQQYEYHVIDGYSWYSINCACPAEEDKDYAEIFKKIIASFDFLDSLDARY